MMLPPYLLDWLVQALRIWDSNNEDTSKKLTNDTNLAGKDINRLDWRTLLLTNAPDDFKLYH